MVKFQVRCVPSRRAEEDGYMSTLEVNFQLILETNGMLRHSFGHLGESKKSETL